MKIGWSVENFALRCGCLVLLAVSTSVAQSPAPSPVAPLAGTNQSASMGSSILSGGSNSIGTGVSSSLIAGGQGNSVRSNAYYSSILGGQSNSIAPGIVHSSIAGGVGNAISAGPSAFRPGNQSFIGSGAGNKILGQFSVVVGGSFNTVSTNVECGAVGGGANNQIQSRSYAPTIGGGAGNQILSNSLASTVAGGSRNTASGQFTVIAGGSENWVGRDGSTVSGGQRNMVNGAYSAVSGGSFNTITNTAGFSFVGAGSLNSVLGNWGTIAGGFSNTITAVASDCASVLGGRENVVSGSYATIMGGEKNSAAGRHSVVLAGRQNSAVGSESTVAGVLATANHPNTFVWSGSASGVASTSAGSFTARAPGGVRFLTTATGSAGVVLGSSGTSWTSLCDRDSKTNFSSVNPAEILSRVGSLPISEWSYKHDPSRRYIGPTAQDFRAAFGLGDDDRGINTLDADGVALAAIKGLTDELRLKDAEISELKEKTARLEILEKEVQSLKKMVSDFPPPPGN